MTQSPVSASKRGWMVTVVMLSILLLFSSGPRFVGAQVHARPFGTIRSIFWILVVPCGGRQLFLVEASVESPPLVQFAADETSVPLMSPSSDCMGITRDGLQSCEEETAYNCRSTEGGTIGDCSCVGASGSFDACGSNGLNGEIGDGSCNDGGNGVCGQNGASSGNGEIGDGSCNGGGGNTCSSNGSASGNGKIGDGSCNGNGGVSTVCKSNGEFSGNGEIGDGSCNDGGIDVCDSNGKIDGSSGKIGDGSCNGGGARTCGNNGFNLGSGVIGAGSCNGGVTVGTGGTGTCSANGSGGTGVIGDGSCNSGSSSTSNKCSNNKGTIASGCCNGNGDDLCNDNPPGTTISYATGFTDVCDAPSMAPSIKSGKIGKRSKRG
eukprot:scaffold324184_cov42-Attheya_sp.AAC.1